MGTKLYLVTNIFVSVWALRSTVDMYKNVIDDPSRTKIKQPLNLPPTKIKYWIKSV